jgi:replication factor C subunit 1
MCVFLKKLLSIINMLSATKPVVLSGQFKTNLQDILFHNNYRILPSLSKHSQLIVASQDISSQLITEATKKGLPIFTENDVLLQINNISHVPQQQLLVDKYKPTSILQIIGHREQIKELTEWLHCWPQKGAVALITGPPGIGKTTTAHLIVKEAGYFCKEYNASDNRTAATINSIFATDTYRMRKEVIIMDEVDGCDRGGVSALAAIIRSGRLPPIICIANDRASPKIKPLLSLSLDIRFSRPVKTTIAKAIRIIAESEKIPVTEQKLVELCEKNGNDIRAIINSLQMESTAARTQSISTTKDSILRQDIFSATQRLFNERRHLSLSEAEQLVFVDYAMVPLMVQECAISTVKSDLEAASRASDLASMADLIDARIHREQAWHLLPDLAITTVAIAKSTCGPAPFNIFPQWLGKNSKRLKYLRQIQNISIRSKHTPTALREDYWSPINVIASAAAAKPTEFTKFLSQNKLTRDDYFETLMESMFEPITISTKEKSAITRFYNKQMNIISSKNSTKKLINISENSENNQTNEEIETDLFDENNEDDEKYYL